MGMEIVTLDGITIQKDGVDSISSPKILNFRHPYNFNVEDKGNGEGEISIPDSFHVLPFAHASFISGASFPSVTHWAVPFQNENITESASGLIRYYFRQSGVLKNLLYWFKSTTAAPTSCVVTVRKGVGVGTASDTLLSVTFDPDGAWQITEDTNPAHTISIAVNDWIEISRTILNYDAFNEPIGGGSIEFYNDYL